MENNNTLPDIKQIIRKYSDRLPIDEELDNSQIGQIAHEYAVLFAKHHRERMIEAVKEKAEIEYKYEGVNQICPTVDPDSIENAYPEDRIV